MVPELRVVMVIPGGEADDHLMPFVRRQFREVSQVPHTTVRPFFLSSRTHPQKLWQARKEFRQLCQNFRPHVIHSQFGTMTAFWTATSGVFGTVEAGMGHQRGLRTRLVITYRGSDLNPTPGDPWLRNFAGRCMSQLASLFASRIICVSPGLQKRLWFAQKRTTVIPNGVDLDRFRPMEQSIARAELNWDSTGPVVLFNARNDPRGKRLDLAEMATEFARHHHPQIRLEILRGNVPPNKMPFYLNACDCLLMTSDFEGSPNIVKEALACNLPVVSVPVGDVEERLQGVTPSAVCSRDAQSLGEGLSQILTDRQRSNGHEVLARSLSCGAVAQQIVDVYRTLWNSAE